MVELQVLPAWLGLMSVINIRPRGEHEKVTSNYDSEPWLNFRTMIVTIRWCGTGRCEGDKIR